MTTVINLTYFGAEGSGATVKEAKQDAGRKLERAMNESATPVLIGSLSNAYSALLFFEPKHGWSYMVLTSDTKAGRLYGCSGAYTRFPEAEQGAKRHLADLLDDVSVIDPKDTVGISAWKHKNDFRQAYATAREQGHTDAEAHAIAAMS